MAAGAAVRGVRALVDAEAAAGLLEAHAGARAAVGRRLRAGGTVAPPGSARVAHLRLHAAAGQLVGGADAGAAPLTQACSRRTRGLPHAPLASQVCTPLPEHCVASGRADAGAGAAHAGLVGAGDGVAPQRRSRRRSATPLPEHWVAPGRADAGARRRRRTPGWSRRGGRSRCRSRRRSATPLPEHWVAPGVHEPVQAPPAHAWLVHASAVPQVPVASQVWTPLPEHWVAPGRARRRCTRRPRTPGWCRRRAFPTPVASHVCTPLPEHWVAPGAQTPAQAPLTHALVHGAGGRPTAGRVAGLHAVARALRRAGRADAGARAADARLVRASDRRAPAARRAQVCTPLPEHCVAPGAQTPVHAPLTQAWLVQATAGPRCRSASQVCTPLPEHCVAPGVHDAGARAARAGLVGARRSASLHSARSRRTSARRCPSTASRPGVHTCRCTRR